MKLGVKQQRKREVMAEKGSSELKTRLKSLTLPHSGDWLNVVPCTALRLYLNPQEFVIVARYRYGCPSCCHKTLMSRATTQFTALQEDVCNGDV